MTTAVKEKPAASMVMAPGLHLSVNQVDLARALATVGEAVPTKSTLPILSHVKLTAENGIARLAATDLDMAITTRFEATVLEVGSSALPATLLGEYLAVLDKQSRIDLLVNPANGRMSLASGRTKAQIAGLNPDDFPLIPEGGEPVLTVEKALLVELLRQTVFATLPNVSRPALNGVRFRRSGARLELNAADGYRGVVRSVEIPALPGDQDVDVLIPRATASALEKLCAAWTPAEGAPSTVAIHITEQNKKIAFRLGDTELVSRLIGEQFPDLQRMIPPTPTTRVTMGRLELLQAVNAACVFASADGAGQKGWNPQVRFSIESAGSEPVARLTVGTGTLPKGEGETEVSVAVAGDSMTLALNGLYVRDALKAITTPEVYLDLVGSSSPVLLRPVGVLEQSHVNVMMPMTMGGRS